jgi:hypothetical protein
MAKLLVTVLVAGIHHMDKNIGTTWRIIPFIGGL